jgi:hypothetical protein
MERIPPLNAAHLWTMSARLASTSPQCQTTTDTKDNNLDRIEHPVIHQNSVQPRNQQLAHFPQPAHLL